MVKYFFPFQVSIFILLFSKSLHNELLCDDGKGWYNFTLLLNGYNGRTVGEGKRCSCLTNEERERGSERVRIRKDALKRLPR